MIILLTLLNAAKYYREIRTKFWCLDLVTWTLERRMHRIVWAETRGECAMSTIRCPTSILTFFSLIFVLVYHVLSLPATAHVTQEMLTPFAAPGKVIQNKLW